MKLMPKHIAICVFFIWVLAFLPFFVPALNTLEPHILGLPFVAAWHLFYTVLHILLLFVASFKVWDTFDKEGTEETKEGGEQA